MNHGEDKKAVNDNSVSKSEKDKMFLEEIFPYFAEKLHLPEEYHREVLGRSKADVSGAQIPVFGAIIMKNARSALNKKQISASPLDVVDGVRTKIKKAKAKVRGKPSFVSNMRPGYDKNPFVVSMLECYGQSILGDFLKEKGSGAVEAINLEAVLEKGSEIHKIALDNYSQEILDLEKTRDTFDYVLAKMEEFGDTYSNTGIEGILHPKKLSRLRRKEAKKKLDKITKIPSTNRKSKYFIAPRYLQDFDNLVDIAQKIVSQPKPMLTPKTYTKKVIEKVDELEEAVEKNLDSTYHELKSKLKEVPKKRRETLEKRLEKDREGVTSYLNELKSACSAIKDEYEETLSYLGGKKDVHNCNAARLRSKSCVAKLKKSFEKNGADPVFIKAAERLENIFEKNIASVNSTKKNCLKINNTGRTIARKYPVSGFRDNCKVFGVINEEIGSLEEKAADQKEKIREYTDNMLAGYVANYVFADKLRKDKNLLTKTNAQIMDDYIKPILDTGVYLPKLKNHKKLDAFKLEVLAYNDADPIGRTLSKGKYRRNLKEITKGSYQGTSA